MRKFFLLCLAVLLILGFVYGQNKIYTKSRNLYIDIYSKDNLIFDFNGAEYKSNYKDEIGYLYTIIVPVAYANSITNMNFKIKQIKNGKINNIHINLKFDTIEDMLNSFHKNNDKLIIYVGDKIDTKLFKEKGYNNIIEKYIDGFYGVSNMPFDITQKHYTNLETDFILPNFLGLRSYTSVFILSVITFIASFGYIIFKQKQIIKI